MSMGDQFAKYGTKKVSIPSFISSDYFALFIDIPIDLINSSLKAVDLESTFIFMLKRTLS